MTNWVGRTMGWDEYFFRICDEIAMMSKDPHTKVGSVIVKDRRILTTGYNGFAPRAEETSELWERPTKYDHVIHAEENAIAQAAKFGISIDKATVYCNLMPCMSCARLIAASGIESVTYDKNRTNEYANKDEHGMKKVENYLLNLNIGVFAHARS